jgi:hypothetical protein
MGFPVEESIGPLGFASSAPAATGADGGVTADGPAAPDATSPGRGGADPESGEVASERCGGRGTLAARPGAN